MLQRFGEAQFQRFSSFIYNTYGITFRDEKKDMLQTKTSKLMLRNNLQSYDDYLNSLTTGSGREKRLEEFVNEIVINKTDFFREINHFDFINNNKDYIMESNKGIVRNKEIRAWSAGCSTGEEAYTLAMILKETFPDDVYIKILATDLSSRVVSKAMKGQYPLDINSNVDKYYLTKYFDKSNDGYRVRESIKQLVTFRLFNLMEKFPFKKSFDMIFCRNVMIYFDEKVQQRLIEKYYEALTVGGLLFIGHSESLSNKKHKFRYIQPTVYMK